MDPYLASIINNKFYIKSKEFTYNPLISSNSSLLILILHHNFSTFLLF